MAQRQKCSAKVSHEIYHRWEKCQVELFSAPVECQYGWHPSFTLHRSRKKKMHRWLHKLSNFVRSMLGKLKVLRIIVKCIVVHAAWKCSFGKQVQACCHIVFVNTRFSEIHFQLACTTIQFSTIPITFNFPSRDLRKLLNLCIQVYDARSAVEES